MEHLTKEEIINKYWDDPTNLLDAVPKIMDEYAKQLAIGFAEWIENSPEYRNEFANKTIPTDKIYELYQSQKHKK
jgi:phenolic acid decarboxylase